MRTVTYKSLLDKISGYLGENRGMSAEDAGLANRLINSRLRGAWEFFWWPECMADILPAQFRPTFDAGAAYAARTEVFYPPTNSYYQALQATLGNLPVLAANCTPNAAWWARSSATYGGNWWQPNTGYALGETVRNPADQWFYACYAPGTSGAALDPAMFGRLTPFVRSLPYTLADGTPVGAVRLIHDADPNANFYTRPVEFVLRPSFILVRGLCPIVYPEVRLRAPSLAGAPWQAGTAYPAGAQVYDAAAGDYYVATGASTGAVPSATPASWALLPVPYLFSEYLAQSVYAALVAKEEEVPEDFQIELTAGFPLLQRELDILERQQGQTGQMNVVGQGTGGGGNQY